MLAGFRPRTPRGRMRGVVPARRGPFVSAKGPKTIGARAWPSGFLCPGPEGEPAFLTRLRREGVETPLCWGARTARR